MIDYIYALGLRVPPLCVAETNYAACPGVSTIFVWGALQHVEKKTRVRTYQVYVYGYKFNFLRLDALNVYFLSVLGEDTAVYSS